MLSSQNSQVHNLSAHYRQQTLNDLYVITAGFPGTGDPQSDIPPQPYLGQVTAEGGSLGSSRLQLRGLRVQTGALRKLPPRQRHAGLHVSLVWRVDVKCGLALLSIDEVHNECVISKWLPAAWRLFLPHWSLPGTFTQNMFRGYFLRNIRPLKPQLPLIMRLKKYRSMLIPFWIFPWSFGNYWS